jgi:hypothetical protein
MLGLKGRKIKVIWCTNMTIILKTMASQSVKNKVYDVVVIGSGVSGLTCACILGKLGKKVLVLEQHDRPGGCLHTFNEGGFQFSSGNHYLGEFDEVSKKLIRTCGSEVISSKNKSGTIETFIIDGKKVSYTADTWSKLFGSKRTIIKAADTMYWVAFVKLAPLWLATIVWCIVRVFCGYAFEPYRDYASPLLRMQEGDVGCEPITMVGAAVTRHYMNGLSKLSTKFVYNACRTIKDQGGRVVVKQTVSKILHDGVISNGTKISCKIVISSVGALHTCALACETLSVMKVAQHIGQSVEHNFVFIGTRDTLPSVTWIKEGEDYLFVSYERGAVHLISETMDHEGMKKLFRKHFPVKIEHESCATKYSVKKYLGRFSSYGLACSADRFSKFQCVRELRPETSMPNLYLTGQDILMPGIASSLMTAMMTCRQVMKVSLLDTILQNDIMDRI